ncbi:nitrous oxide reductase accessory protein NosL [Pedobacter changchengzhani]|uniref:nitrous oxide reductase accessory protein NosL n=1 Tax=Pedobacter changchengzhani TaxID=2529274 RepID=UPI001A9D6637|nr:nitrous oxide reductase accessory protein NosL [Pedobacter changchengzhani]
MQHYKKVSKSLTLVCLFLLFILSSCKTKPQPIKLGDSCSFCKMGVADERFGAELITQKGKAFKFDDVHCLIEFVKGNTVPKDQIKTILFVDFEAPHEFIESENSFLLKSDSLRSPMGSNISAYKSEAKLKENQTKVGGEEVKWSSLDK